MDKEKKELIQRLDQVKEELESVQKQNEKLKSDNEKLRQKLSGVVKALTDI